MRLLESSRRNKCDSIHREMKYVWMLRCSQFSFMILLSHSDSPMCTSAPLPTFKTYEISSDWTLAAAGWASLQRTVLWTLSRVAPTSLLLFFYCCSWIKAYFGTSLWSLQYCSQPTSLYFLGFRYLILVEIGKIARVCLETFVFPLSRRNAIPAGTFSAHMAYFSRDAINRENRTCIYN